jgi:dephospho-CoA kinase
MLSFSNYLKEEIIEVEEGVNDPAIFKAVFLAGGPGSGKSFIVGKTGLQALGFKVVNSDDAFEKAMTKAGLETTPDNIFSVKGQELRGAAKALTGVKQNMWLKGRLGLVIDGTGKDTDKLKKQAATLKKLGYDVAMIFVNTDLATAQARNLKRKRTLPADEVEKYWTTVQKNIGAFQTYFGKQKFTVVDNSEGKDYVQETLRAYKEITKFTKNPPENSNAKKWIAGQKASKK